MYASTSLQHASDGAPSFVHRWQPGTEDGPDTASVRGLVYIAHGMAEHAGRYARFASALCDAGYAVFANDHRGHGQTAAANDLGHFGPGGFRRVVADARELVRAEAAAQPGLPVVLFGHSMGSFIVQSLLFDVSHEVAGVILCGSNGKPTPLAAAGRLVARVERKRVGPRGFSPVLSALSFDTFNKQFRPNRTDFDWLSRDPAEVDVYVADPLCGFACSTELWVELLDALADNASPKKQAELRKDLPLCLISGAADAANEHGRGVVRLAAAYLRAGLQNVFVRLYPEARHELLNETNREEVTKDLVDWIGRELGKR